MRLRYRKMVGYSPYEKQKDFHRLGASKQERILFAGNQQGKSHAGAYEAAVHATGLYPPWWDGRVFGHATRGWCASVTNRKTRDIVQKKLLGPRTRFGTGMIPAECIIGEPIMSRGLTGYVDTVSIRHRSGGTSEISFKSYDEAVDTWASDTIDWGWLDEEAPLLHYLEFLARLTTTKGIAFSTLTPLKGMAGVVRLFYPTPSSDQRSFVKMGLKDALHIPVERHADLIAQYPESEREARIEGTPQWGTGLVYGVPWDVISVDPFHIPAHYFHLIACDLGGGGHPWASVHFAIDRDTGRAYLIACYKQRNPALPVHAAAMRAMGGTKHPIAWPLDALTHSRHDGSTYADMLRDEGLKMLPLHAQFPDGSYNVEPGISLVWSMLSSGQLRVFSNLFEIRDELMTYHRKDGDIVKENDDLLDAIRYGVMMLRFAEKESSAIFMPDVVGMDYDPLNPQRYLR